MAATKHLFVGKDVAYAAKIASGTIADFNEVNLLDSGAIAFFAPDGTLLTTGNVAATMAAHKEYYIAVGSGDATKGAKVSIMIPKVPTSLIKEAYDAPVKQRSFLGEDDQGGGSLNLPTFATGAIFSLRIVDLSNNFDNTSAKKWNYEYVATAADTNLTAITKLIALINADTTRIVNATVVGSQVGIQFDAINNDQAFGLTSADVLSNATRATDGDTATNGSINVNYGNGRPEQLLKLEDETTTYEGRSGTIMNPTQFWNRPSEVDSTKTYDIYNIVWDIVKGLPHKTEISTTQFLYLALEESASQQSDIETILAELGYTA